MSSQAQKPEFDSPTETALRRRANLRAKEALSLSSSSELRRWQNSVTNSTDAQLALLQLMNYHTGRRVVLST